MSNAIVSLVVIALMLMAVLTWSQTAFTAYDSVSQSLKQTVQATQETARTDITVIQTQGNESFVRVYVLNSGAVHLAQFAEWDVLVQYYDASGDYHVDQLTYTENSIPTASQWSVFAIYTDESYSKYEVFEPGILNPGEVMFMMLELAPLPGAFTTNLVTVSTANGVATSAQFNG